MSFNNICSRFIKPGIWWRLKIKNLVLFLPSYKVAINYTFTTTHSDNILYRDAVKIEITQII